MVFRLEKIPTTYVGVFTTFVIIVGLGCGVHIYIYMSMEIDYKVLTQELVSDSSGVVDC